MADDYDEGVASDALPLAMSPMQQLQDAGSNDQQELQVVNSDVNVADVAVNENLKPLLQRFCDKTSNPADKAKALELLTALQMSDSIKAGADAELPAQIATPSSNRSGSSRRPQTAAPRLQQREQRTPLTYVNNYETTHDYFFQPPQPSTVKAVRPASSQIQRIVPPATELAPGNSFSDLYMQTTYSSEFFAKKDGKPDPERAASARGVRNNNPHPHEDFLVWRYRRPLTATQKIESTACKSPSDFSVESEPKSEELTNETFDRAVRGKCRSVYKTDYLGVPPTFNVGQYAVAQYIEKRPKYDASSTSRRVYTKPPAVPYEISVPKQRFSKPLIQSRGVIPSDGVSKPRFGVRSRTTYDLHVNEPANRFMKIGDLRYISNAQNAESVAKLLEGSTGAERASLMKLYHEMNSRSIPVSIPLPVERRIVREKRIASHLRLPSHPAYMSTWTGP